MSSILKGRTHATIGGWSGHDATQLWDWFQGLTPRAMGQSLGKRQTEGLGFCQEE